MIEIKWALLRINKKVSKKRKEIYESPFVPQAIFKYFWQIYESLGTTKQSRSKNEKQICNFCVSNLKQIESSQTSSLQSSFGSSLKCIRDEEDVVHILGF